MFDQFTHLVAQASGWAYLILFVLAAVDAVVPVVPSETAVITAGVVAANGDLLLPLVILSAGLGAFAGDNIAYLLGFRFGDAAQAKFFHGEKAKKRLAWAEHQLDERGGELIVVGRFIPGGRTAITLSAGLLRYPWRRFVIFDAIAALIWATYAAGLGFVGGKAFEDAPLKGLILAFSVAFAITGIVEGVRWLRNRRAPKATSAGQASTGN